MHVTSSSTVPLCLPVAGGRQRDDAQPDRAERSCCAASPDSSWSARSTGCGPPWFPGSSGCRSGWASEQMRLDYTPEQEQLRDEVRATMQTVMTPARQAAVRECVQALAAAGLLGVEWPKESDQRPEDVHQRCRLRRLHLAGRPHRPVARQLLEVLDHNGLRCGTDAPATRHAGISLPGRSDQHLRWRCASNPTRRHRDGRTGHAARAT